MSEEFVASVSERYIELFEQITGEKFQKADAHNVSARIEKNVTEFLNTLK
jgi:phosphoribosylaminoimidazole-succinocarboxamide synthase